MGLRMQEIKFMKDFLYISAYIICKLMNNAVMGEYTPASPIGKAFSDSSASLVVRVKFPLLLIRNLLFIYLFIYLFI